MRKLTLFLLLFLYSGVASAEPDCSQYDKHIGGYAWYGQVQCLETKIDQLQETVDQTYIMVKAIAEKLNK